jgi:hypothetical protein
MLVFTLAFLLSAAGSMVVPWLADGAAEIWFLAAPMGGILGGMAAGFVIGRRHLAWLGFFVGVLGCAAAQVLAWLVLDTSGDTAVLWYFLGWGCVPFVAGCYIGAAAGAPSRGDQAGPRDGALWAIVETLKFWT